MGEVMVYINDNPRHRVVSNRIDIEKRNLMVIARHDNGFFYPGNIAESWGKPEEAEVNFYQWGRKRVPRYNIITIGGAVPWPNLHVWDYVLTRMRVLGPSGMYIQYMPGRVCYVPRLPPLEHRFYAVRIYNGKIVDKKRKLLVKISKSRYLELLDFLQSVPEKKKRKKRKASPPPSPKESTDESDDPKVKPDKPRCKQGDLTKIEKAIQTVSTTIEETGTKIENKMQIIGAQMDSKTCQTNVENINTTITLVGKDIKEAVEETSRKISEGTRTTADKIDELKKHMKKKKTTKDSPIPSPTPSPTPVPQRKSEGEEEEEGKEEEEDLRKGQEVLARWSDDGWYYFGLIESKEKKKEESKGKSKGKGKGKGKDESKEEIKEESKEKGKEESRGKRKEQNKDTICWMVKDSTGHTEYIQRRNILTEEERKQQIIQKDDHVIAPHPDYYWSYAPGRVIQVFKKRVNVVFFDDRHERIKIKDVYKISQEQYHDDVITIQECEEELKEADAVMLDKTTGKYIPVTVRAPTGQQWFKIFDPNTRQRGNLIFPNDLLPASDHLHWKYTLAPVKGRKDIYMPARIRRTKPLYFIVQFCDKQRPTDWVAKSECFYLNKAYYDFAVKFYQHKIKQSNSAR
ncbi:uncharacterized protein LOC128226200 [Mya arenaria]|uniref:uncharacterized protein LOC128226200 n=1 Tax=Mya arenaria TaxID=6604 RepID=UPI0022E1A5D3|nr:uncharacterized protein LOC128226200 [Mya arenaria]